MHHISVGRKYISFPERLKDPLQWADSSERIHSSRSNNPKVSFTEERQTFRCPSVTQSVTRGFTSVQWDTNRGQGGTGPDSEQQKLRVGLWILTEEPNGGKKVICQPTTAAKDIWSFALEGLVLEEKNWTSIFVIVPCLLGPPKRNTHTGEIYKVAQCGLHLAI